MPPPVKHSPVTKGRGNSPGVSKLPGWAADESATETAPEATGAGPLPTNSPPSQIELEKLRADLKRSQDEKERSQRAWERSEEKLGSAEAQVRALEAAVSSASQEQMRTPNQDDSASATDQPQTSELDRVTRLMELMQAQINIQQQTISQMPSVCASMMTECMSELGKVWSKEKNSVDGSQSQPAAPSPRTTARPTVKTPPILPSDVSYRKLRGWLRLWENYRSQTDLGTQSVEFQRASFLQICSVDLQSTMEHTLKIPIDKATPEEMIEEITKYVKSKRNLPLERLKFMEKRQNPNESVDDFNIALQEASVDCDISEMDHQSWMVTFFLAGLKSKTIQSKLLAKMPLLTLSEAVDFARIEERAVKQSESLNSRSKGKEVSVAKSQYQKTKDSEKSNSGQKKPPSSVPPKKKTSNPNHTKSGTSGQANPKNHPDKFVCYKCGSRFKEHVCPAKHQGADKSSSGAHQPGKKLGGVQVKRVSAVQAPTRKDFQKVQLQVFNTNHERLGRVQAVPDTGAEGTLAPVTMLGKLGLSQKKL